MFKPDRSNYFNSQFFLKRTQHNLDLTLKTATTIDRRYKPYVKTEETGFKVRNHSNIDVFQSKASDNGKSTLLNFLVDSVKKKKYGIYIQINKLKENITYSKESYFCKPLTHLNFTSNSNKPSFTN